MNLTFLAAANGPGVSNTWRQKCAAKYKQTSNGRKVVEINSRYEEMSFDFTGKGLFAVIIQKKSDKDIEVVYDACQTP